tara:strand:- start:866 stop:1576 length:711 start_codon:yes stop_codon:yes gene_type:complete
MIQKNKHKGKRCFIVATGSSLNKLDLSLLRNEITIGINLILRKEDFVPNYLCIADTTVMEKHYHDIFNDKMNNGTYVICNGCTMTGKGNCTDEPGSTCRGMNLDHIKNKHTVLHWETSGIFVDHIDWPEKTKLLKTDQYYIDPELETITSYGGSTVDNLAIPLAVYLGCNEIYLIGADAGYDHFYDNDSGRGKRDWINYNHVLPLLNKLGVKLYNSDPTNVFTELKYKRYEDICRH